MNLGSRPKISIFFFFFFTYRPRKHRLFIFIYIHNFRCIKSGFRPFLNQREYTLCEFVYVCSIFIGIEHICTLYICLFVYVCACTWVHACVSTCAHSPKMIQNQTHLVEGALLTMSFEQMTQVMNDKFGSVDLFKMAPENIDRLLLLYGS